MTGTAHRSRRGKLQNGLDKSLRLLNSLEDGSVVIDRYGHAWQASRHEWYRCFGDGHMYSSWNLAAERGPLLAVYEGKACHALFTDRDGKTSPCGDHAKNWGWDDDTEKLFPACDRHQTLRSALGESPT